MEPEQFNNFKEEIKVHLEEVLEKKVNGKINNLTAQFNAYVVGDLAWKKEAQPFLNVAKIVKNWGIATGWLVGVVLGLASLYAAILGILDLIKKLRS